MQFQNIFVVLLLASMCCVYGFQEPLFPSHGDYMEYYLSVSLSCSNVTDLENVRNFITEFAQCIEKFRGPFMDILGYVRSICENQESYLQCWDQFKQDITTNCHDSGHLPAVYTATLKSYCGNDKGNLTISNLSRAYYSIDANDLNDCSEDKVKMNMSNDLTENCKPFLESRIFANVCERQEALDKCLEIYTCMNVEFGKLQKQVYSGGRAYLNCDS